MECFSVFCHNMQYLNMGLIVIDVKSIEIPLAIVSDEREREIIISMLSEAGGDRRFQTMLSASAYFTLIGW